ncbi:MAG: hypothetical protein R3B13_04245 [Polyangiaceae bacterium]
MSESEVFDWVTRQLERRTHLSRLEARGTVRLVLKDAGLDAGTVAAHQMAVVLVRLMPAALTKRRVEGSQDICGELAEEMQQMVARTKAASQDTAYEVFERLESRGSRRDPS